MTSLSLLELLGLGNDLPTDWRSMTRTMPDEQPLLFRWVEFVQITPLELAQHFLVPVEWWDSRRELVVVPWPGSPATQGVCDKLVVPGLILPYFRLYRAVEGRPCPEPLQVDHPHFCPKLQGDRMNAPQNVHRSRPL